MSKLIPPRPAYKPEKRSVGYLVLAIFLLSFAMRLLSSFLPFLKGMLYLAIGELVLLLAPFLFFAMMRGKGYGKAMRIKMPRAAHVPFLIASLLLLLFGSFLLVLLVGDTAALGNVIAPLSLASDATLFERIIAPLLLAIVPAVVEGFVFRGALALEYERRGAVRAVLMSALLYAAVHFDLPNFLVHAFVGVVLMVVLYATDSFLSTVILHALLNLAFYFGSGYMRALFDFTGNLKLMLFLLIFGCMVSLLAMLLLATSIYRARDEYGIGDPRRDVPYAVQLYTILDALADPCVVVSLILAVLGFIFF